MKKDKLNNLLTFKDFDSLNKLNNKPGIVLESSDNKALNRIMNHPIRKKTYEKLLETNKSKADKYLNFWKKHDIAIPEWDNKKLNFINKN